MKKLELHELEKVKGGEVNDRNVAAFAVGLGVVAVIAGGVVLPFGVMLALGGAAYLDLGLPLY